MVVVTMAAQHLDASRSLVYRHANVGKGKLVRALSTPSFPSLPFLFPFLPNRAPATNAFFVYFMFRN